MSRSTKAGARPACTHRLELRLHVGHGLVHLVDGFEQRLVDHPTQRNHSCHVPPRTELPATVRSEGAGPGQKFGGNPWSQVDRLPMGYRSNSSAVVDDGPDVPAGDDVAQRPGLDMSNTTMGILLSRQKAIAVASITLRPLVITSR